MQVQVYSGCSTGSHLILLCSARQFFTYPFRIPHVTVLVSVRWIIRYIFACYVMPLQSIGNHKDQPIPSLPSSTSHLPSHMHHSQWHHQTDRHRQDASSQPTSQRSASNLSQLHVAFLLPGMWGIQFHVSTIVRNRWMPEALLLMHILLWAYRKFIF